MRSLHVISILLLISIFSFAQKPGEMKDSSYIRTPKKSPGYFCGVSLGVSLPRGNFAATDSTNGQSGYANTGGFLFADYGLIYQGLWGTDIGIGFELALKINVNPLNDQADEIRKKSNPDDYKSGQWYSIQCPDRSAFLSSY
jgi:hypothetical protein